MQDPDTSHLRTAATGHSIPVSERDIQRAERIEWMGRFVKDMERTELLGLLAQMDMLIERIAHHGYQRATN